MVEEKEIKDKVAVAHFLSQVDERSTKSSSETADYAGSLKPFDAPTFTMNSGKVATVTTCSELARYVILPILYFEMNFVTK
jgi:hypothetical protein